MSSLGGIRQGDRRWNHDRLGEGESTIGRAGCLLCCLAECAVRLEVEGAQPDPRPLQLLGVTAGAFVRSMAITEKLAQCAGLECGPRVGPNAAVMREVVTQALLTAKQALMHVDHDSSLPNGDAAADHWVLAVGMGTEGICYADPATGGVGYIDPTTMTGPATWGRKRMFAVRACRVLGKRQPS